MPIGDRQKHQNSITMTSHTLNTLNHVKHEFLHLLKMNLF